ncbi:MAG: SH3 domain-containing protein [Bacilli bacterium]|nr:SH3 domain-containing protein [Bacilli bacterium]
MQRIVDPVAIISCTSDIYNYLEELTTAKNNLKNDIESISSVYKGTDSQTIINKYLERAMKIETIISNYTTIGTYLKKVGVAYNTNLTESKKNIAAALGKSSSVGSTATTSQAVVEGSSTSSGSGSSSSSGESSSDMSSYQKAVVKTSGGKLVVRKSASSSSKALGKLKNNTQIYVVKKGKTWTKIVGIDKNGNKTYGYVATKYISMS